MNVDVAIYMSNLMKFFDDNPKDLSNLIPLQLKDKFYEKVQEIASKNAEGGNEIPLTKKQLIELCVGLNGNPPKKEDKIFVETEFGNFFLNWKKIWLKSFFVLSLECNSKTKTHEHSLSWNPELESPFNFC